MLFAFIQFIFVYYYIYFSSYETFKCDKYAINKKPGRTKILFYSIVL